MKRLLLLFFALLLMAPQISEGKSDRLYEKWVFRSWEDIDAWDTAGLEKVELVHNEIRFDVNGQAVFYRALPPGFRRNVDALRLQVQGKGLDEAALLFIKVTDEGKIGKHTRLTLGVQEGDGMLYVPLDFYPAELYEADLLALSLKGTANGITFGGIRFIHYSLAEKLGALWKSFWTPEVFAPHTINLIVGPALTTDAGPFDEVFQWYTYAVSVNAYFLLCLALVGMGLLLWAYVQTRTGKTWNSVRRPLLVQCFLAIGIVWLLYDFRMGWEFVRNVARDHVQYIAASADERTFRDYGRFYDFTDFAEQFVGTQEGYEVFLPDLWPYLGMMRYLTYPMVPHGDEPVYDTWAIFARPDVFVENGRLRIKGVDDSFTREGEVLGRFDKHSFVFREFPDR